MIAFKNKKMLTLIKEELKSHQDAKVRYICGKRFLKRFANDKIYWKVRNHCHYTTHQVNICSQNTRGRLS